MQRARGCPCVGGDPAGPGEVPQRGGDVGGRDPGARGRRRCGRIGVDPPVGQCGELVGEVGASVGQDLHDGPPHCVEVWGTAGGGVRRPGGCAMRLAFRPLPLPRVAHRLPAGRLGERFRGVLGEMEGDQAVAVAEPPVAGPHDGAGGDQFVEHRGSVVAHARRQDLGLPQGRRQRDARELLDRAEEAVHAPEGSVDSLRGLCTGCSRFDGLCTGRF